MRKALVILMLLVASVALAAYCLMVHETRIQGRGTVKAVGIGVYWDSSCTAPVTTIDWGLVEPGSQNSRTVYIRNEGNTAVQLTMTTENWSPQTPYLSLTWDYDGRLLQPNEVVTVSLTLAVAPDIRNVTDFSFDIIIAAFG